MKKHFRFSKTLMRIIGYYIVCLYMSLTSFLKGLLTGSLLVKVMEMLLLLVSFSVYIYNKEMFIALMILFFTIEFGFAVYVAVIPNDCKENKKSFDGYDLIADSLYFNDMTVEEAKKEYRRLMKKYHPDNAEGDTRTAQMISNAYREYCSERRM